MNINVSDFSAAGDGVTDDTCALQSAINSANGSLVIPAGNYLVSSTLTLKSDLTISGEGRIKLADGASTNLLFGSNLSNLHIRGITLDLNKENQTAGNGIILVNCTNCSIENLEAINSFNDTFLMRDGCSDYRIVNNVIRGSGNHSISVAGDPSDVDNCTNNAVISGNQIFNPTTAGINFSKSRRGVISGNIVEHDGTGGAHDQGHGGVRITNGSTDISITGNYVTGMSRGLFIKDSTYCSATGNVLENSQLQGIFVQTDVSVADYNVISGNVVKSPGMANKPGSTDGIFLANADWCTVTGNTITSLNGNMENGINISRGSKQCAVTGNTIQSPSASSITVDNETNTIGDNTGREGDDTIASASTVTLPGVQSVFNILGTATITEMKGGWVGRSVTLRFSSTATVQDGGNLRLSGNFAATNSATLTLMFLAGDWYEVSRSVN